MIKNKLVSTRLMLSVGFLLSIQNAQAVKLSLDNSVPINLSENISYDISDEVIEISSSDPIICRNLTSSNGDIDAEIIDPNGDGELMPLIENVSYDIGQQTLKAAVNTENGVCVTKRGSTFGDLIFSNGFIPATFKLEGLNEQVVRGQSLDYSITIENADDTLLEFDLIEYVSTNPATHQAFFESVDLWNCISHNVAGVDCNQDNTDNRLINAAIPPGQIAEIEVSRTVGSGSTLGQSIEVLTAMFIKDVQGNIVDVRVLSQTPTVVDNSAPVLNWSGSTSLSFIEDDSQAQTLSFDVFDNTGVDLSISYLTTAIGGVNDKVNINNIDVNENQPGEYEVSFDVTPKTNQFTSVGNTEQIFVQIEDIFNASSNLLMLGVDIEPINDAPSFTPSCVDFTINPTPVGGETEITCNVVTNASRATWNYTDFIENISAGGVGNNTEAGQSVIFEVDPISGLANSGSVLVTMDPGTFILNDLMLILNDGESGEGRFRIRALDNGTPGGETDVCPAVLATDHCSTSEYSQEIVFNVLEPVYFVSGIIDDLPSGDELGIRLYEAGTSNPLGGTMLISGLGATGNQMIKFTYPEALANGVEYDVQINLTPQNRTCSITAGATGTINNMNMGDLVIDCDPL